MNSFDLLPRRHQLVYLNSCAHLQLLEQALRRQPHLPPACVRELVFSGVPGIVCRQDDVPADFLGLGFSSHRRPGGTRLRVATAAPMHTVQRVLQPEDLLALELPPGFPAETAAALQMLAEAAAQSGFRPGLFGSAAMQIVTGRPYLHRTSDLDLTLTPRPEADAEKMFRSMEEISQQSGIHIDAEYLHRGYGIKLRELCGTGRTVMGKGLREVRLFERTTLRPLPMEGAVAYG